MYKFTCSVLLAMVFPFILVASDHTGKLFAEGNRQYAKGQYEDAIKSYGKLIDSGYHAPELYYNLGNAYYKTDEIPSAILYYEKAYKLAPGDDDIRVNLQLANSKITDKIETVPEFFLAKWWRGLLLMLSSNAWSISAVLCLLTGFSLLVVYLFSSVIRVKKGSFYTGVVLLAMGFLFIIMAQWQRSYFDDEKHAIIFTGVTDVKSGPDKNMKTLFVIHEGLKVSIEGRENNWLRIALPNGSIGWIESAAVKEI